MADGARWAALMPGRKVLRSGNTKLAPLTPLTAEAKAKRRREELAELHRYREGSTMVVECSWGPVAIRPRP